MLAKLKSGSLDLLKIAVLIVVLISFVKWANGSPDSAAAMMNKIMGALASLITWVCDQIISLTSS